MYHIIILFVSLFSIGFCLGQMPRIYRLNQSLKKTGTMLDNWENEDPKIIEGRLQVTEELNKFL